jgi:pimeloyl-ACP methyl ester carboxylesterase
MQALKIYNAKAKSYIATVIYRYLPPATTDQPVTTRANQPDDRAPTTTAPAADTSSTPTTDAENSNSAKLPMTLIYSHGNATDIGGMSFLHCYLARALQLNVVMYDYSGYGESGSVLLISIFPSS